jgi:hypothetical protein
MQRGRERGVNLCGALSEVIGDRDSGARFPVIDHGAQHKHAKQEAGAPSQSQWSRGRLYDNAFVLFSIGLILDPCFGLVSRIHEVKTVLRFSFSGGRN